jgi:serine protease Do
MGISEPYDLAMLEIEAKDLKPITWADSAKVEVGQWVAAAGTGTLPVAVGVVSVERRAIPPQSGVLGIMLGEAVGGVRVLQVFPDSGAAHAGLHVDDLVVGIAGRATHNRDELVKAVQNRQPGEQVKIAIRRGAEHLELDLVLGSRTVFNVRGSRMNHMGGELSSRSSGFPDVIQHDTVLAPSECGGPLVDLDGKALGINIARAGRTESYAIPADVIVAVIPALESGNLAPPKDWGRAPTTQAATTQSDPPAPPLKRRAPTR